MPTIYDVARLAKVSVSTVSRVINGGHYVQDRMRRRVDAAMQQLHYRPLRAGRSLRRGRSQTIGMVLPDIINPAQVAMLRGACDRADGTEYIVMLGNTGDDSARESAIVDQMIEEQVAGAIIVPHPRHPEHVERLMTNGIATVLLARTVKGLEADAVVADNVAGGLQATGHLIGLGHRSIAMAAGPFAVTALAERHKGYLQALRDAGIEPQPGHVFSSHASDQDLQAWAADVFGRRRRPTAVAVFSVRATIPVLRALKAMGLGPPEVSVLCIEHDWCDLVTPPLTALEQPSYEMGARSMEILLERISVREQPRVHRLPMRLIVRGSTSPPRSAASAGTRS